MFMSPHRLPAEQDAYASPNAADFPAVVSPHVGLR